MRLERKGVRTRYVTVLGFNQGNDIKAKTQKSNVEGLQSKYK